MKKLKEKPIDLFENLSIILTGFSKADLAGTGLLQTYFETVKKELGKQLFEAVLEAFKNIKVENPDCLSVTESRKITDLMNNSNFKHPVNQIIQLWYLGEWVVGTYNPKNYIISSESYLEGLIWKAIAAHPMGGKQPGYATWGFPPLTFSSKD
ncbi:hypothetical protein [Pontimicrobium sp. MEBiC01747]